MSSGWYFTCLPTTKKVAWMPRSRRMSINRAVCVLGPSSNVSAQRSLPLLILRMARPSTTVPAPFAEAFSADSDSPAHNSAEAQTRNKREKLMAQPLQKGKQRLSKKLYARYGPSSSTEAACPQDVIIRNSEGKHSP